MLEAAKGKIELMIELKAAGHETDLVPQTIERIQAAGMEEQCVIVSMDPDLLRQSKELAPRINTVYITVMAFSEHYDLPCMDGYSVKTGFLTAELVAMLQTDGKKVYARTANSDASILKIIRMGINGLVTDNPPLAEFFLSDGSKLFSGLSDRPALSRVRRQVTAVWWMAAGQEGGLTSVGRLAGAQGCV